MIAVIADDFTGAAELAGISLRYGLQVKLYTGISVYEACDVCIVSSDSRSMRKSDSLEVTRNIVTALNELSPSFIYKKTDSVLRGYVLDEINVQMQITRKQRAVILPANPSLGRKIISGKYYIGDQLIADTNFSKDPEFPVKSSLVTEMLGAGKDEVSILTRGLKTDQLPVSIAEAASTEDVEYWAKQLDHSFLLAGAADFFEKLLENSFREVPANKTSLLSPHLYVCGTTATSSREVIGEIMQQPDLVALLQEHDLVQKQQSFSNAQLDHIKNNVAARGKLLLAIGNAGTLT
ncbi:MAG: four-carbon acid sugar kinase family protein, partial [Chitinophagaceae bacterium]|nr:four-carbon acid sugar kinase family protein [Chitinophagaceae bacterium]